MDLSSKITPISNLSYSVAPNYNNSVLIQPGTSLYTKQSSLFLKINSTKLKNFLGKIEDFSFNLTFSSDSEDDSLVTEVKGRIVDIRDAKNFLPENPQKIEYLPGSNRSIPYTTRIYGKSGLRYSYAPKSGDDFFRLKTWEQKNFPLVSNFLGEGEVIFWKSFKEVLFVVREGWANNMVEVVIKTLDFEKLEYGNEQFFYIEKAGKEESIKCKIDESSKIVQTSKNSYLLLCTELFRGQSISFEFTEDKNFIMKQYFPIKQVDEHRTFSIENSSQCNFYDFRLDDQNSKYFICPGTGSNSSANYLSGFAIFEIKPKSRLVRLVHIFNQFDIENLLNLIQVSQKYWILIKLL
jgi:hypothetical protein